MRRCRSSCPALWSRLQCAVTCPPRPHRHRRPRLLLRSEAASLNLQESAISNHINVTQLPSHRQSHTTKPVWPRRRPRGPVISKGTGWTLTEHAVAVLARMFSPKLPIMISCLDTQVEGMVVHTQQPVVGCSIVSARHASKMRMTDFCISVRENGVGFCGGAGVFLVGVDVLGARSTPEGGKGARTGWCNGKPSLIPNLECLRRFNSWRTLHGLGQELRSAETTKSACGIGVCAFQVQFHITSAYSLVNSASQGGHT